MRSCRTWPRRWASTWPRRRWVKHGVRSCMGFTAGYVHAGGAGVFCVATTSNSCVYAPCAQAEYHAEHHGRPPGVPELKLHGASGGSHGPTQGGMTPRTHASMQALVAGVQEKMGLMQVGYSQEPPTPETMAFGSRLSG